MSIQTKPSSILTKSTKNYPTMPVSLFLSPYPLYADPLYSSSSLQTKKPTNVGLDVTNIHKIISW